MADTTTGTGDAPKAPDTTTTKAPDAKAPDGTADLAAQVKTLSAQLETLTKAKTEADAKAEEARKASLSEADKLKEERTAFAAEVANTKAGLRKEARSQALDRLGVLPNYRDFAPDADPTNADGAKQLADWAKGHPEVVKVTGAPQPPPFAPAPESMLGKVLAGVAKSPYITKEGLQRLIN